LFWIKKKEKKKCPIRVLVVGSNGQLGKSIKHMSLTRDDMCFIFTDKKQLNILNFFNVERFLKSQKIDVVINAAGWTDVSSAELMENRNLVKDINVNGPSILAKACKLHNVKLIHISTDYVFEGDYLVNRPLSVTQSENPKTFYGKTKFWGERQVFSILPNAQIVRTSVLFSNFGKNLIKTFFEKMKFDEPVFAINDVQFSPTNALHLSSFLFQLIISISFNEYNGEIFHYTNQGITSPYQIAIHMANFLNSKSTISLKNLNQMKSSYTIPKWSVLDCSLTTQRFGKIPTWQQGINEILEKFEK
jgi:dTDP-4-dehydrorhamnose reductase